MQHGQDDAVYHEPISAATRVLLFLAGLVPLLAPYELLVKPGVPVFQLGMIPFWVIAIGASCVSILLLAAAVLGFTKTVHFDHRLRRMTLRADGIFGFSHVRTHAFERLGVPAIRMDAYTEGPPVYRLEIPVTGRRRPIEIAVFKTESEAAIEADLLRTILKS